MIYLDVACNDPDNGLFAGRAPMLQLGCAELSGNPFRPPRFVELDNSIRLSGKLWHCNWSKEWLGNWCWNRYLLTPPGRGSTHRWYLVEFVKWLRGRKLFHCDVAPSDFFDWFNNDLHCTDAGLHSIVCDLEGSL